MTKKCRYSTGYDVQTEPWPVIAQYADYAGPVPAIDTEDTSIDFFHNYENNDTALSPNNVVFNGSEFSIIPEVGYDQPSRYSIAANSSVTPNNTAAQEYDAYQYNAGAGFTYNKILIKGFQTD